ncbi:hypothetical protein Nocox_09800 [Nonomuraea coxensis DSM 45129]|uniref:Secreted protein n=1 Tax=Nonomuraea coxensis DSM 45129 TaxID=1122611 RepID=A0ABX8TVU3_9ACTN|nr:hypothetical protein [Nonomuraea coxensis]QYC39580.1 hypothetical protein Nocox_09800 [Nonomuraea coxensis DSM 45129]
MRKLFMTGVLVAAAAGAALLSAPAHADTNSGNASRNTNASQSGNIFGSVVNRNTSGANATGVSNVNGNAVTTTHRGSSSVDDVIDW